ncbi:hypothetical protein RJZ56_006717 [Blastomyces dermatitidis]|uniref:Uncharacterized protein n=3 Tax=Blastomyces TaxID=229219 RepID=A0A179UY75_BLAGS|nr:uncharacterized protein BDBG_06868 [Blastomyces gilchristii SLH14081]XP_045274596.1 uncharacterized protein BDCG_02341 [Blastomyces dermatitidis ER-3]EGE84119.1 hypothetical protein BDDG_07064 [Blastomyces dermatitidis ATCC 18188]EQL35305.1 hypothetical protein BDFG_03046 [Blastomyces dermatitidis ATCC 26199]EEQ87221.1 hypothetical protein BDCG_02341 [Blastomyces dermatitidis ER-3]OAT11362.1 hypothetical protein BDBG_06868 [Blastomyces gilchristii SLH14081]
MPTLSLMTRDEAVHRLAKRNNWAAENAGVMLVFCILFVIAVGLIILAVYRWNLRRKAARGGH